MKLLAIYCVIAAIAPMALILLKSLAWLGLSWGWTLALAFAIPFVMVAALVALAVYVIKSYPESEWND